LRNLPVGEFPGRGHLQIALVADRPGNQALLRLARDECRPAVASLEGSRTPGQAEPAADFLLAVARLALRNKKRANLSLEELDGGGIRLDGLVRSKRGTGEEQ